MNYDLWMNRLSEGIIETCDLISLNMPDRRSGSWESSIQEGESWINIDFMNSFEAHFSFLKHDLFAFEHLTDDLASLDDPMLTKIRTNLCLRICQNSSLLIFFWDVMQICPNISRDSLSEKCFYLCWTFMLHFHHEKVPNSLSSKWLQSHKNDSISRWTSSRLLLIFHLSFLFLLSGAAKKRDVRTINSSPCDLGPPSKTSTTNGTTGTVNRSIARTISTLRKFPQLLPWIIYEHGIACTRIKQLKRWRKSSIAQ